MKKLSFLLLSLFTFTVNAQHIRVGQIKSTGEPAGKIITSGTDGKLVISGTNANNLWTKSEFDAADTTRWGTNTSNLYKLKTDSLAGYGYFTNYKATFYRLLTNHDSLSTLQEKSYNSLNDKPDLTIYKQKSDSINSDGYTRRDRLASQIATRVAKNASITPATNTKITYDAKGLVTGSSTATTADIPSSTDKRYVTDTQLSQIHSQGTDIQAPTLSGTSLGLTQTSTTVNLSAINVSNTPVGTITSTTVQGALNELDTEKVPTTRTLTINGTAYDLSADRSWTIAGAAHDPVTLGTANGLTLSTQQLSMNLASGTVTGTLSPSDWNTFNNKLSSNQTITLGGILSGNGTTSINASAASGYYMPTTTDQSNWNGKQTALSGTGFVKISGTTISYDNSTYLTSYTETDPVVKAINGIVKSNGSTLSAAVAGTDYLTPTGSAASLTNFPTLNQNTSGTAANVTGIVLGANGGTGKANSGKTITLGGNIVTSGAFNLSGAYTTTLTVTNNTSITLPTTGTLSTLAGSETFTNKIYDFSSALGSNQTYSGIIESGTVGENVVFGDVLYLKFSDGKWWKAKADAYATTPAVRMAMASISANASGVLLIEGNVRYDSWSFTARNVWLSAATAGAITTTQPSSTGNQIQYLGVAKTSTTMYFKPSTDVGEK